MRIRKAKKEDLKTISTIFIKESSKYPYHQKWTYSNAYKKFKNDLKEQDIFSIESDNSIIGFITLNKDSDKEKMYLDEFWIDKDSQGKGIGKEVMNFIEHFYKKKGIKNIKLVARRKTNAFNFYKKLRYIEDNDLVFMNKKI